MKRPLKTLLFLLFFVALLIVGAATFADRLVKRGIEEGGTRALGVETLLDGVALDLRGGKVGLTGLHIANPEGFPDPHLLEIESIEFEVPIKNLLGEVVDIELIALRGAQVVLDRRGERTNFEVILDNLERLSEGGDDAQSVEPEGPAKRFRIGQLRLEDIHARLDLGLPGAAQDAGVVELDLAPIILDDLDYGGEGSSIQELSRTVVTALLHSSIEAGGAHIPDQLRKRLEDSLGDIEQQLQESVGDLERRVDEVEDRVKDALGDVNKDLGGLLGRDKDED